MIQLSHCGLNMPAKYSRYLCKIILYHSSKKVHTEIFVKLLVVVDLGLG